MLLVENRDLLDRFRRGDSSGLEDVFRAYAPGVATILRHGFVFSSGGRQCRFNGVQSEYDLEDRLHDVFARAFSEKVRLGYDGLTPFAAYLGRISKNLVIDDFRKKERALTEYSIERIESEPADSARSDDPIEGQTSPTGQPEEDAAAKEVVQLVAAFEASLSDREREVYTLRFRDHLDHKVISQKTGLSPSKVKTSEKRIRIDFFEFMKRHGYFDGYQRDRGGWLRSLFGV